MANGKVIAICIAEAAGAKMKRVNEVMAIAGRGLDGDRYANAEGSFNRGQPGKRQVTLINAFFVDTTHFTYEETRRGLIVDGIELMDQIGHEFSIDVDGAVFRGVKYCDPCMRPSKLSGKPFSFGYSFWDRGGLVAEIRQSGIIRVGATIITRSKSY